jgi:magnesium transporter
LPFACNSPINEAMLRAYGPGCDGAPIEARSAIPEGATWIDLEEPTGEEERLVEQRIGVGVPTQEELDEIEPSSRLYDRNGALYMTVSVLCGVVDGNPTTTPVGFVLTRDRLVTIRYATPKPIRAFMEHVHREPELALDPGTALGRLLDAIIDRLADELEAVSAELEKISAQIFAPNINARRIPADRLTQLLTRIGRTQTLLAKIRYSAVSMSRMLSFLSGSGRAQEQGILGPVRSLVRDTTSLSEHASFLTDNVIFLLDAALGLISIEQNAAMKVFSWVAVVLMPPTLIAGIYGMNFRNFPELEWHYGYALAIVAMLASAIIPFWILKRLRWI